MPQKRTTRKATAVILTECLVTMTVLGILLAGFWYSLGVFRTFSRIQTTRLRCTAAAEAQLDSLTATGLPIDDATVGKLWPGVTLHLQRAPGEGKWTGLRHLSVRADAVAEGRPIRMDFRRYVASNHRRAR